MPNKVANFVNEVKLELKKVNWSSREEIIASTVVVIVSVILLAFFIGIFDLFFSRAINILIR